MPTINYPTKLRDVIQRDPDESGLEFWTRVEAGSWLVMAVIVAASAVLTVIA